MPFAARESLEVSPPLLQLALLVGVHGMHYLNWYARAWTTKLFLNLSQTRWDADAICDLLSQGDDKRARFLARKNMTALGPPAKYTGADEFECPSCFSEFPGGKLLKFVIQHV